MRLSRLDTRKVSPAQHWVASTARYTTPLRCTSNGHTRTDTLDSPKCKHTVGYTRQNIKRSLSVASVYGCTHTHTRTHPYRTVHNVPVPTVFSVLVGTGAYSAAHLPPFQHCRIPASLTDVSPIHPDNRGKFLDHTLRLVHRRFLHVVCAYGRCARSSSYGPRSRRPWSGENVSDLVVRRNYNTSNDRDFYFTA